LQVRCLPEDLNGAAITPSGSRVSTKAINAPAGAGPC